MRPCCASPCSLVYVAVYVLVYGLVYGLVYVLAYILVYGLAYDLAYVPAAGLAHTVPIVGSLFLSSVARRRFYVSLPVWLCA